MKFLPTPTTDVRRGNDDSLGHGMDAVITLLLFMAVGFGIDSLVGTTPVFVIVMLVIGAVGLFVRFYYQYARRMNEHEAVRLAKLAGPADASSVSGVANNADDNGHAA